jgi:NhaP-type Na+/H+ or K+/H+ antiporter
LASAKLIVFSSIPVIGVLAQWLAWRLRISSILILLISGFIAGPVLGIVDPDALLGDLLFPFVSLSVAIILFEGGLSLNISDLKHVGKVVRNLISIGALVTWIVVSLAARFILGLDEYLSFFIGSVLVVTGPTVIIPMLRQLRLQKNLASVLRWEGIVIDPIGVTLSVLVFEILTVFGDGALNITLLIVAKTLVFGGLLGVWGALMLMIIFSRRMVPDYLFESITLCMVIACFVVSGYFQEESGLLAVTVMGIILANQKEVVIKRVVTFKENLTILLLSSLFVLLAARLPLELVLQFMTWKTLFFLMVVVFVARPLSVFISTIGTRLRFKEKVFLSFLAPRGIVAAAVISLLSIRLIEVGYDQASQLVPITFLVIIFTVLFYGLVCPFIAKLLGVVREKRMGVLLVGAHDWAIEIGIALKNSGLAVTLVDTNKDNVLRARDKALAVIHGSILSARVKNEIESGGIGYLVSVTPNDEVNLLASIEYGAEFGVNQIFRLAPQIQSDMGQFKSPQLQHNTNLFGKGMTYSFISSRIASGAKIKVFTIVDEIKIEQFLKVNSSAVPLFVCDKKGQLFVFSQRDVTKLSTGARVVCLV